ncbi:nucleoside deaminase [Bacillus sp. Marseille-P3661]|uniref:nucleoside deaminase n=1 Tax=Bacillus sp. Marseille-P3661 TaxID=1936234 RepID=UPI000C834FF0|nr:nucleoside deaminase [Bacillus sp. Marseille-P3661]
MPNDLFMKKAIDMAYENVRNNTGGPFGALVVKDGEIIGEGKNQVTETNDPTAHAEIQAIRAACEYLKDFQLTGCEIYTSCEPCPMCIGAIYWARPKAVYFACTKEDAASIGFDDHFIYEEIALPIIKRKIKMEQYMVNNYDLPFKEWKESKFKREY